MAKEESDAAPVEPVIRVGDGWIQAHHLAQPLHTANRAADAIERFNTAFPHLASTETRTVVPLARRHLKEIELRIPRRAPDLARIARGLIDAMSPEDVTEVLGDKYATELDLAGLIGLIGEAAYLRALAREAKQFALNQVSPEQTADLWREAARPVPGGGMWSAARIRDLLG